VYKRYLPTLSEVICQREGNPVKRVGSPMQQRIRAEQEWSGAIAALNELLKKNNNLDTPIANPISTLRGTVLCGPFPVLDQPELIQHLSTWVFTVDALQAPWVPPQLPSAAQDSTLVHQCLSTLPLLPQDPLAAEQFCVGLTDEFSVVLVLGETNEGEPAFLFSFAPEVVWQAWQVLRSRLLLSNSPFLATLDFLVEQFTPFAPDYRTVAQFMRSMLANLPDVLDWDQDQEIHSAVLKPSGLIESPLPNSPLVSSISDLKEKTAKRKPFLKKALPILKVNSGGGQSQPSPKREQLPLEPFTQAKTSADTELLQAIAHEVRTPLTTIRTLTRLLLKRKDLNRDVTKRLEIIDRECTEQIDRFNLIFRAVELETAQIRHPLTPPAAISLKQVLQENIPRWQEQAKERNLTLDIGLPPTLPLVLADPSMLDQVLTGLIDRITHRLPPGSHIKLQVQLAGHQLKLQFHSYPRLQETALQGGGTTAPSLPELKSLGQMLMFQPETGNLSLNLAVTKNLFQALGGKLIVRQRPQQGEVLTVFLPMETQIPSEE